MIPRACGAIPRPRRASYAGVLLRTSSGYQRSFWPLRSRMVADRSGVVPDQSRVGAGRDAWHRYEHLLARLRGPAVHAADQPHPLLLRRNHRVLALEPAGHAGTGGGALTLDRGP